MLILIKGGLHFLAGRAAQSLERGPGMQGMAGESRGSGSRLEKTRAPWLHPRFWGFPLPQYWEQWARMMGEWAVRKGEEEGKRARRGQYRQPTPCWLDKQTYLPPAGPESCTLQPKLWMWNIRSPFLHHGCESKGS